MPIVPSAIGYKISATLPPQVAGNNDLVDEQRVDG